MVDREFRLLWEGAQEESHGDLKALLRAVPVFRLVIQVDKSNFLEWLRKLRLWYWKVDSTIESLLTFWEEQVATHVGCHLRAWTDSFPPSCISFTNQPALRKSSHPQWQMKIKSHDKLSNTSIPMETEYLKLGLSQNIWEATLSLTMRLCYSKEFWGLFQCPEAKCCSSTEQANHMCINSPGWEVKYGWIRGLWFAFQGGFTQS